MEPAESGSDVAGLEADPFGPGPGSAGPEPGALRPAAGPAAVARPGRRTWESAALAHAATDPFPEPPLSWLADLSTTDGSSYEDAFPDAPRSDGPSGHATPGSADGPLTDLGGAGCRPDGHEPDGGGARAAARQDAGAPAGEPPAFGRPVGSGYGGRGPAGDAWATPECAGLSEGGSASDDAAGNAASVAAGGPPAGSAGGRRAPRRATRAVSARGGPSADGATPAGPQRRAPAPGSAADPPAGGNRAPAGPSPVPDAGNRAPPDRGAVPAARLSQHAPAPRARAASPTAA
ncbi:hypothetical protein ACSNOK_32795, partial [Streptomyces sp. URMC 126]